MSRDLKKDMERVELSKKLHEKYGATVEGVDPKESLDEVLIYWLQEVKGLCEVNQKNQREILNLRIRLSAEKERADKSEEREKVLKHAFIVMLGYVPKTARVALDFDEVLASLYPKEGTK